ncbi:MAG: putative motility protein [Vicinamibacterales bacterium]
MTISIGDGATVDPTAVTTARIAVAVMKKTQDAQKAEGEVLLQLVQQALPDHIGRLVNTRA